MPMVPTEHKVARKNPQIAKNAYKCLEVERDTYENCILRSAVQEGLHTYFLKSLKLQLNTFTISRF